MDKRKLTKKIVNNTNGIVLGAVTRTIIQNNTRTFENRYLNLAMSAGIVISTWSVKDVVLAPVQASTDAKIDEIFDAFAKPKKTEPQIDPAE